MIDLVLSKGNVYVWNAEDWLKLRQEHRVIGSLIGCLPKVPRQDVMRGLPLLLLPEEVTLLLEKKIARLVTYPFLLQEPSKELVEAFRRYREKLFHEQNACLRTEKMKMIESHMDQIIEGKRRKLYGLNTSKKKMKKPLDNSTSEAIKRIEIDRDALFAEEMAKIVDLEPTEQIVQTHTAYPWTKSGEVKPADWRYPASPEEKFKYRVYRDLWERGYFVTLANKYGGDFLAYPGDPMMFHAQLIVFCRRRDEDMTILDLTSHCRLATHVRKTAVFAYLTDNDVLKYQSFLWDSANATFCSH